MKNQYRIFKTVRENGNVYFYIKEKWLFWWFKMEETKVSHHWGGTTTFTELLTFNCEQEAIDYLYEINKPVAVFKPKIELIREIAI